MLKPVLPDPGVPFQLVHHDDVATALRAAVLGRGEPGVYNLAAAGELTISDLADALGWHRADARARRRRRGRDRRAACRSCPTRRRGSRRCAARCSWTRARRAGAELAPAPRRAGDAAPGAQRLTSVTGTSKRCSPRRLGLEVVLVVAATNSTIGRPGTSPARPEARRAARCRPSSPRAGAPLASAAAVCSAAARRRRSPRRCRTREATRDSLTAGDTTSTSAPSRSSPGSAARTAAASTGSVASTRSSDRRPPPCPPRAAAVRRGEVLAAGLVSCARSAPARA